MAVDIKKIVDQIKDMNALELNELSKAIQEEFGVSAMPTMVAGGGGAAAGGGEEESSSFDVKITDPGANKMAMIKLIKEMAGLALGEAKAYVEDAGRASMADLLKQAKGYSKAEAEELKGKLEKEGAKVEIVTR